MQTFLNAELAFNRGTTAEGSSIARNQAAAVWLSPNAQLRIMEETEQVEEGRAGRQSPTPAPAAGSPIASPTPSPSLCEPKLTESGSSGSSAEAGGVGGKEGGGSADIYNRQGADPDQLDEASWAFKLVTISSVIFLAGICGSKSFFFNPNGN